MAKVKCSECKGAGQLALFTSVYPCDPCEGTGAVELHIYPEEDWTHPDQPKLLCFAPVPLDGEYFLGLADAPAGKLCIRFLTSSGEETLTTDPQELQVEKTIAAWLSLNIDIKAAFIYWGGTEEQWEQGLRKAMQYTPQIQPEFTLLKK